MRVGFDDKGWRMKITDNSRVGGAVSVAAASAARPRDTKDAVAARRVADTASILGIPAHELTPKVREAIFTLMAEVERLRQDADQNNARIAYLEKLADQDSLVPAFNRRAFVRELSRMMSFAERYGTPGSVLYFDINRMKEINDTHGHAAGDAALQYVAETLTREIRESDVVGRLGGDEFGVILANADEATALEKGAALVGAIENGSFRVNGADITLTASFGAYTFDGGGDASEILNAADRDMYGRKSRDKPDQG